MGEKEIASFLSYLAVDKKVAASTQNQALCTSVFLYRHVLQKELRNFENLIRAKKTSKLPVVFNRVFSASLVQCHYVLLLQSQMI